MPKTPWLPLQIKILHDDGIPKDTIIVTVPRTSLWLELKKWTNGRFRVCLCEPNKNRKRLIIQSIDKRGAEKLIDFALLPHKDCPSKEKLLTQAKQLLKRQKRLRWVEPKKSKNPGKS